jgi:hypothetical protein
MLWSACANFSPALLIRDPNLFRTLFLGCELICLGYNALRKVVSMMALLQLEPFYLLYYQLELKLRRADCERYLYSSGTRPAATTDLGSRADAGDDGNKLIPFTIETKIVVMARHV